MIKENFLFFHLQFITRSILDPATNRNRDPPKQFFFWKVGKMKAFLVEGMTSCISSDREVTEIKICVQKSTKNGRKKKVEGRRVNKIVRGTG